MEGIEIDGHRIKTDEYGEVVCPWPNGQAPKGYRKPKIRSDDAAYLCRLRHLHKVSEFPKLMTNDIKPGQIHTREG